MTIDLFYEARGQGRPLVLLPGWSQTTWSYHHQLEGLSDSCRVIALDLRGHGRSPKPAHGYRVARLARDVCEFLEAQALDEVVLCGHSMGAAVVWSYLEQFGRKRLSAVIFIDQAPMVTDPGGLSDSERLSAGVAFTAESLSATALAVETDQADLLQRLKPAFFSSSVSDEDFARCVVESQCLPAAYAARLLRDHGAQDWRDVIEHLVPELDLPVLVFGGELATIFPAEAARWIADRIPGAQLSIFSSAECGSHFLFRENAEKFNGVVRAFLERHGLIGAT